MSPGNGRGRPGRTAPATVIASPRTHHHRSKTNVRRLSSAPSGLERAIENAGTDWIPQGYALAFAQLARKGMPFTIDDVLIKVGRAEVPQYIGAAAAAAIKSGLVETFGCRISPIDGRPVRVYWPVQKPPAEQSKKQGSNGRRSSPQGAR